MSDCKPVRDVLQPQQIGELCVAEKAQVKGKQHYRSDGWELSAHSFQEDEIHCSNELAGLLNFATSFSYV